MPRYFFDLHNDISVHDEEGEELADLRSAQLHALTAARQMIALSIQEHGRIDLGHNIRIRDQRGIAIDVIEFGDAVRVFRGGEPV